MSHTAVIFNPVAGRGSRDWATFEKELMRQKTTIYLTEKAGDAERLAQEAIKDGAQTLVAAGGDGTLGEVTGVIVNSNLPVSLGVLPLGTGNDFARTLGLFGNPKLALDAIYEGALQRVDVGCLRCEETEKIWINVAGCGFDSLVARRINAWGRRKTMRHIRGLYAYLLAVARELTTYHTFDLKLELDGEPFETKAVLCAIANAKSYGGGMLVCPQASLDDGLFDVCVIGDASRAEFLRAFPGVFAGRHVTHPKVTIRRCRSIRVECSENIPILADGEIVGAKAFCCELVPRALSICVPQERG